MSDKDREGGGLAVLVLAGFLVLLLLAGGGGVALFAIRQAEISRREAIMRLQQARLAADVAEAEAMAAKAAVETAAPSASETPNPTQ